MSRIHIASFFMLLLVAAAFALLPAGHQAAAQPGVPTPYKCYQLIGTLPPGVPPVDLQTHFGVELMVGVGPAGFLCMPALKNGVGDLNQTPYKAYMIANPGPNRRVKLETQFGVENVLVGPAAFLWEPALVNGQGSLGQTPYKCYQISDEAHNPGVLVDLTTMFAPNPPILEPGVLVGTAQYLCEPAKKNGVGDLTQTPYKCYGISNTVPPEILPPGLVVETQFGVEFFEPGPPGPQVSAALLLCDPATEYATSVGGLAELPDVASDSGSPTGTYAALAGGLAAAIAALGAGAWYARRRWAR